MKKFTFKKDRSTGLFGAFASAWTDIKLNKKVVGYISQKANSNRFVAHFAVQRISTKQNPAPFKWIRIKKEFITEDEARKFVRNNNEKIQSTED